MIAGKSYDQWFFDEVAPRIAGFARGNGKTKVVHNHLRDAVEYLYGGGRGGGKVMHYNNINDYFYDYDRQRHEERRAAEERAKAKKMEELASKYQALSVLTAAPPPKLPANVVKIGDELFEVDTRYAAFNDPGNTQRQMFPYSLRAKKYNPMPELKPGMVARPSRGANATQYRLLERQAYSDYGWRAWSYQDKKIMVIHPDIFVTLSEDGKEIWSKD